MASSTGMNQNQRNLFRVIVFVFLVNLYSKSGAVVEAGSKSSKGTSKTTVIAIDGGSGGAKPHPVPIPWPVVHCHHHHHHMKYVPKPVMVHHWVKKFKYGPEELSATNVHDSKHLMPTMIDEHEVPLVIPSSHVPDQVEEVKMQVDGLDSTYEDISSRKLKAEASNYGDTTMAGANATESVADSGKPSHPFSGSTDQELDESRISVNRNPAMSLVASQLRRANEIEQTKARRILERLLQEQSSRLSNIYRDNQVPLHLRGRHALSQAESRSVELMSKLASQRANHEARKLISRMTERARINDGKAREATSGGADNNNAKTNRPTFSTGLSAIRNLFGFNSSGSGHNRLSRASIRIPATRQWHVAFGDPLDFSASSVRGRVVAPPTSTAQGSPAKLDIELETALGNNATNSSTTRAEFTSAHYSPPDHSSYSYSESFGSMPMHMSPPELFKRMPSTSASGNNNASISNNQTRVPNWNDHGDKENILRRPDELVPDDPLSLIPSYLEFPVTPELWSEQALKSINAAKKVQRYPHHIPQESMNMFTDPMASSSDWTSPSMADLNELFEFSNQHLPKGVQASSSMRDVSTVEQFEAIPSGSMVNPQSSNSQSFDSLHSAMTGGAPYLTSGSQQQSMFQEPYSTTQLRPSPFDSNVPFDTSSSFPDPLMESSNQLNQMRQFQSLLSQPMANNLTGMVRLSGQLRNPMAALGATQAAQMPNIPNIPSPPNIPMPGLPAPGMLLQMAGLALPFALARAQRQSNRQTQPINTAASVASPGIPRQRLLTRALNTVTRRRPRRPNQSPSGNPFSRLTGPQSTRIRNFVQTVRDMSQPTRSKPRTRINPKMDGSKGRKSRVGRAMQSLIEEQRFRLPIDSIPLAVQTDGSLRRFVPATSPLGELEREMSRRQVAQQVDSFIPPQETLNRSPMYEFRAAAQVPLQPDSSTVSEQPSNKQLVGSSTTVSRNQINFRRESSHAAGPTSPVATGAPARARPEESSVVETESQEFGQRQSSPKGNNSNRNSKQAQGTIVADAAERRSTPEPYPTLSPMPSTAGTRNTQQPSTPSTVAASPIGSPEPTMRPTQMRPANYVQAFRLVRGLAHTRLASAAPKVS